MGGAIDTEVRGDAGSVGAVASYIRRLGSAGTTRVNDIAADAKRDSLESWEGGAGDAYRESLGKLYRETDTFERSITRSAEIVEDYAVELTRMKNAMLRARQRATEGNLVVHGDLIQEPGGPGVPADLLPGFEYHGDDPLERQRLAGEYAAQLRRLYHELAEDVRRNREHFHEWIESHLGDLVTHLGGDDLLGPLGGLPGPARFGLNLVKNVGLEGLDAASRLPDLPKDVANVADAGLTFGAAGLESIDDGSFDPLAEAASSEAAQEGVGALGSLGKKGPWTVLGVGVGKTVIDEGSDALFEATSDDDGLPERPPRTDDSRPYAP